MVFASSSVDSERRLAAQPNGAQKVALILRIQRVLFTRVVRRRAAGDYQLLAHQRKQHRIAPEGRQGEACFDSCSLFG